VIVKKLNARRVNVRKFLGLKEYCTKKIATCVSAAQKWLHLIVEHLSGRLKL
jgi:hypothetical protein